MTGISKRFPGVQALENVDLEVVPARSMRCLARMAPASRHCSRSCRARSSRRRIEFGWTANQSTFASPHDAQRLGIVTIYQEFTLAPNMTIAENVFIGREPGSELFVSWRRWRPRRGPSPSGSGSSWDPMTLVRDLSVAEQQMVEIARALSMQSRLIVMDEPTSALSSAEVDKLFRIVRDLKARGLSIIFVTHRLEEVMQHLRPLHRPARRPPSRQPASVCRHQCRRRSSG